jgi:nitroreductase
MEFCELVQKRYSVRAYRPDPVEPEKLQLVLEAARLAPTAHNNQPFRLLVIHTEGRQAELNQIYHREWFVQPPLVIGAIGIPAEGWVRRSDQRNFAAVDVAIMMDHLVLQAADLGLGTCWIANFNVDGARQVLNLPSDVDPVAFTPLGYPADSLRPKERRPLSDLVRWEHWS